MSEQPQSTPESKPDGPAPAKPRRSLLRRLFRLVAIVCVLIIAARILFSLLLPVTLKRLASSYGFDCTYERSEVNLLSGDAALWHLKFTPKSGGEPIADVGYVRGNISILALLKLQLDVWRAEADGVEITIDREADGRIPLIETLIAALPAPEASSPAAAPQPPKPVEFLPPLQIEALRLQRCTLTLRDKSLSPALTTKMQVYARLSYLGSAKRPTTFDVAAWSEPGLELIRAEGRAVASNEQVEATARFQMRGLRLDAAEPYLRQLGIAPQGEALYAGGSLSAKVARAKDRPSAVAGQVIVQDLVLKGERGNVAALGKAQIDLDSADSDSASISQVLVDGGEVHAGRAPSGRFLFAGLELVGIPEPAGPATRPAVIAAASAPPAPVLGSPAAPKPYLWRIDRIKLTNSVARFDDQAVPGGTALAAELQDLTIDSVVFDPSTPDSKATVSARGVFPGVVGAVKLEGFAQPFAADRRLELKVAAENVRPVALEPYLAEFGLESTWQGGAATASLSAGVAQVGNELNANLRLTDARLSDAGVDLLAFKNVSVDSARIDPDRHQIRIGNIEIVGPTLPLGRDKEQMLRLLGVRTRPGSAAATAVAAAATTRPGTVEPFDFSAIPSISIDRLSWSGVDITLVDRSLDGDATVNIDDAGVQITNVALGADQPSRSGTIKAWLRGKGLVEELLAEGTIQSGKNTMSAEMSVAGRGIAGDRISPFLASLGIEPTLRKGAVELKAGLDLAVRHEAIEATARVDDLTYRDGETSIFSLRSARLADARLTADRLVVGTIAVQSPTLEAGRDREGALLIGGLRFMPGKPSGERPAFPDPLLPLPVQVGVNALAVENATVRWRDQAASKPVDVTATASLSAGALNVGPELSTGTFHATLVADSLTESATATGTISLSNTAIGIRANTRADGLNAASLAGYFPPGVTPRLRDGSFAAEVEASVGNASEGGATVALTVTDLSLSEGEQSLARLGSFRFVAPRIDPGGGVIAIRELSTAGVEAEARILSDGTPTLLGLALTPVPVEAAQASTQPAVIELAQPGDAATSDVASLVAGSRKALPLVTVDTLDLRAERLTLHNDAVAGAAPATIRGFRLHNLNRVEWAGVEPEKRPVTDLQLVAQVDPIVSKFQADFRLALFADQPRAEVVVGATGVRGEGLTELLPPLVQYVDGKRLADGRFETRIQAQLRPDRRGGGPADYSRGFGMDLLVTNTMFRNGDDPSPVLAGLESIRAEGVRVEPPTGSVTVKSLDITKPAAYLLHNADGLEVFGLVLNLPGAGQAVATQPSSDSEQATAGAATTPEAGSEAAADSRRSPGGVSAASGGEIRIDKLTIAGLDVRLEDRTVDPPVVIPLNSLDLEAAGLSNRVLTEPRPVRFNVVMSAGKVALPRRIAGGVLPGALSDLGSMLEGKTPTTQPETEERELFSQIAAGGRVTLYPEPKGYAKASINGLELAAIRGLAQSAGIALGGGVFDANVDLRLKEEGLIDTRTKLVLTDLQLSEPANGPIVRYLKLPAPLDAVIGAVQDASGAITLPINVPIRKGELQVGAVIGSATGALGQVLAKAVASAPVKVVQGVGGLLGPLDKGKKPREPRVISIGFAGGDASIDAAEWGKIRPLLEQLRKDGDLELTLKSELTPQDISIAAKRASPPPADCMALAGQLRLRRSGLLSDRAIAAATARSQVAAGGATASARALNELRRIDREIAEVETSLDQLLEQLKPGAERQSETRTRAAAIELGRQRLASVRDALMTSGARTTGERVRTTPPQFAATEGDGGGRINITLIEKK